MNLFINNKNEWKSEIFFECHWNIIAVFRQIWNYDFPWFKSDWMGLKRKLTVLFSVWKRLIVLWKLDFHFCVMSSSENIDLVIAVSAMKSHKAKHFSSTCRVCRTSRNVIFNLSWDYVKKFLSTIIDDAHHVLFSKKKIINWDIKENRLLNLKLDGKVFGK